MLQINHIATESKELNIVRQLFRDYEKELNEDLCFQSFEEELKNPLQKYGGQTGALLLAYWNNEVAGCIALTALKEKAVCEMKRLYVVPAYRKHGIGHLLVTAIVNLAKEKGYITMKLDTLLKLQPAIKLYENVGFNHISAYYSNPIKDVVYMEKKLV